MKIRLRALEKKRMGPVAEDADVEVVAYVQEEADVEETDEEKETDGEEDTDEEEDTYEEVTDDKEEEEESAIAADPDWLPLLDDDSPSHEQ